jgi:hypothetical protein
LIGGNGFCCAIVAAISTGVDLRATAIRIARVGALEAVVAIAIELACRASSCAFAEAFALTAVSTGQVFDPIVACSLMSAYLNVIA